jgi:hypothetical protein
LWLSWPIELASAPRQAPKPLTKPRPTLPFCHGARTHGVRLRRIRQADAVAIKQRQGQALVRNECSIAPITGPGAGLAHGEQVGRDRPPLTEPWPPAAPLRDRRMRLVDRRAAAITWATAQPGDRRAGRCRRAARARSGAVERPTPRRSELAAR